MDREVREDFVVGDRLAEEVLLLRLRQREELGRLGEALALA